MTQESPHQPAIRFNYHSYDPKIITEAFMNSKHENRHAFYRLWHSRSFAKQSTPNFPCFEVECTFSSYFVMCFYSHIWIWMFLEFLEFNRLEIKECCPSGKIQLWRNWRAGQFLILKDELNMQREGVMPQRKWKADLSWIWIIDIWLRWMRQFRPRFSSDHVPPNDCSRWKQMLILPRILDEL